MKKRFYLALSALAISTALTIPVFAGTWKQDNTGWWYERDDKSFPVSVWEQIDGSWYYFNENGYMLSNQWLGNYYLGSTGAMLTNTIVDGYQIGADGAYIPASQSTGSSKSNTQNASTSVSNNSSNTGTAINNRATDYILNKNSHVFHYSNCTAVQKMREHNKIPFSGTRDEAISKGYTPCQICHP